MSTSASWLAITTNGRRHTTGGWRATPISETRFPHGTSPIAEAHWNAPDGTTRGRRLALIGIFTNDLRERVPAGSSSKRPDASITIRPGYGTWLERRLG